MVIDYIAIKNLQISETYNQTFFITHVEIRKGNKGEYGVVKLTDTTGEITGYVWDYTRNIGLKKGSWAKIKIKVQDYKGEKSFIALASDIILQEVPPNKSDYTYSVHENVLKVNKERIQAYIASIEDADYRDIIGNATVPERLDLINLMQNYPYALKGHLACDGGLLLHTNALITIALANVSGLANIEVPINKSLIIAGAIFRSIGWASTTYKDIVWMPNNSYYLTGVHEASFMMANHICMTAESDLKRVIPEPKKAALFEACLKNNIAETYTPENKILISSHQLLDSMFDAETKLLKAKIGQDSWVNALFVGHHVNRA